MSHRKFAQLLAVLMSLILASGCDSILPSPPPRKTKQKGSKPKKQAKAEQKKTEPEQDALDTVEPAMSDQQDLGDEERAADQMVAEILAAAKHRKTLAVWFIDQSASAVQMRGRVSTRLAQEAAKMLPPGGSGKSTPDEAPLLLSVVGFGKEVSFVTPEPTADPEAFANALNAVPSDDSGAEMTFTAINKAADKYLPPQGRDVIFVIVTNEAGDDADQLESTIARLRRDAVTVYVLGAPAPFGAQAGLPGSVEGGMDAAGGKSKVSQGPESLYLERINLAFWGNSDDSDLSDSGFGPFALTRLASSCGGRFVTVRSSENAGFGPGSMDAIMPAGIDPDVMRDYKPDYVSDAEYKAILASNKAAMALHNAAKLPRVAVLNEPKTFFQKRSEAEFVRDLSAGQQASAVVEQNLNKLYETLAPGEADRDKLPSARWKAAYDLALGRAMAAKVRNDSYNMMLAAMKGGRNFTNPISNTWYLQPSMKVETGSVHEKLATKSRTNLERVVNEHKGTPWAILAERELQNMVGWEWIEQ